MAWVGLTEKKRKKGISYETATFPWAASGRAIASDCADGMTKLIFDKETHRVIGGAIVGTNGGELLGEIGLAIEMGCDAEDIALTIHAHPTLHESVGWRQKCLKVASPTCQTRKRRRNKFLQTKSGLWPLLCWIQGATGCGFYPGYRRLTPGFLLRVIAGSAGTLCHLVYHKAHDACLAIADGPCHHRKAFLIRQDTEPIAVIACTGLFGAEGGPSGLGLHPAKRASRDHLFPSELTIFCAYF